jgi:hypothetical protein
MTERLFDGMWIRTLAGAARLVLQTASSSKRLKKNSFPQALLEAARQMEEPRMFIS